MVDFTEETARKNILVKKVDYTIAQPFAEGHVCTANEANALNQLLCENVRNNFSAKIKEDAPAPSQEDFDKYVASYQFGVRSVASTDPIEKEMRKIVEAKLKDMLAKAGKTKASLSAEEYKNAVDAALEKNRDKLYPIAKEIVMRQTAAIDLDI